MFDLKIVNGVIVSGDGSAGRPGEIGVRDGRIETVADRVSGAAETTLDANGHIVCPGFIDLHTHCWPALNENYLQSGVTLAVSGNCGFSDLDIKKIAAACSGACGLNLAMLIGHNTVRVKAMGNVDRAPSAAEMREMRELVGLAMAAGASGFSTGLTYVPGNYAATDEVVELARVAAERGGYYTSHMRDESAGLLDSVRETVEIGRSSGMPVHISHLKVVGKKNWGMSRDVLSILDEYLGQGLDVTQDQYPYTASCGRLLLLFPAWAQEGGPEEMHARLADREQRARLKQALIKRIEDYYGGDAGCVVISMAPDPELGGRSLADIASDTGRRNEPAEVAETVLELVERFPGQTQVYCVFHGMSEDDVEVIMRHEYTTVGSDGWAPRPAESHPHPRMFGTFPRVLGHYTRDRQVFTLEEAVRRMTGLPARRLGLNDRGLLREGFWADITVFNPDTVLDKATFENPAQYPVGFEYVVVNGRLVMEHGRHTGVLPGIFIPGNG